MEGKKWYALNVKGGSELKARDWLEINKKRFDVIDDTLDEVFVPVKKTVIKRKVKKVTKEENAGEKAKKTRIKKVTKEGKGEKSTEEKEDKEIIRYSAKIPSYLFIHGNVKDSNVIQLLSTAPNVYGFVGCKYRNWRAEPQSISEREIQRIKSTRNKNNNTPIMVGDTVLIKSGQFKEMQGTVESINSIANTLKVSFVAFRCYKVDYTFKRSEVEKKI